MVFFNMRILRIKMLYQILSMMPRYWMDLVGTCYGYDCGMNFTLKNEVSDTIQHDVLLILKYRASWDMTQILPHMV